MLFDPIIIKTGHVEKNAVNLDDPYDVTRAVKAELEQLGWTGLEILVGEVLLHKDQLENGYSFDSTIIFKDEGPDALSYSLVMSWSVGGGPAQNEMFASRVDKVEGEMVISTIARQIISITDGQKEVLESQPTSETLVEEQKELLADVGDELVEGGYKVKAERTVNEFFLLVTLLDQGDAPKLRALVQVWVHSDTIGMSVDAVESYPATSKDKLGIQHFRYDNPDNVLATDFTGDLIADIDKFMTETAASIEEPYVSVPYKRKKLSSLKKESISVWGPAWELADFDDEDAAEEFVNNEDVQWYLKYYDYPEVDPEKWGALTMKGFDSGLSDEINEDVVSREMQPYISSGDAFLEYPRYGSGIIVRVYDDEGKITPAFIKLHELMVKLVDNSGVLDPDALHQKEYDAAIENIEFEGDRFVHSDAPQGWPVSVYRYLAESDEDRHMTELESMDDRGAYPSREIIEEVLKELGIHIEQVPSVQGPRYKRKKLSTVLKNSELDTTYFSPEAVEMIETIGEAAVVEFYEDLDDLEKITSFERIRNTNGYKIIFNDHAIWYFFKNWDDADEYALINAEEYLRMEMHNELPFLKDYVRLSETDIRVWANDEAGRDISYWEDMDDEQFADEFSLEFYDEDVFEDEPESFNEDTYEEYLDNFNAARDTAIEEKVEEKYEAIEEALQNPYEYFVEDRGQYSIEQFMQKFQTDVDFEKAAKEFIRHDSGYFVNFSNEYEDADNGLWFPAGTVYHAPPKEPEKPDLPPPVEGPRYKRRKLGEVVKKLDDYSGFNIDVSWDWDHLEEAANADSVFVDDLHLDDQFTALLKKDILEEYPGAEVDVDSDHTNVYYGGDDDEVYAELGTVDELNAMMDRMEDRVKELRQNLLGSPEEWISYWLATPAARDAVNALGNNAVKRLLDMEAEDVGDIEKFERVGESDKDGFSIIVNGEPFYYFLNLDDINKFVGEGIALGYFDVTPEWFSVADGGYWIDVSDLPEPPALEEPYVSVPYKRRKLSVTFEEEIKGPQTDELRVQMLEQFVRKGWTGLLEDDIISLSQHITKSADIIAAIAVKFLGEIVYVRISVDLPGESIADIELWYDDDAVIQEIVEDVDKHLFGIIKGYQAKQPSPEFVPYKRRKLNALISA